MDESVICLEESPEIIDLCESLTDTSPQVSTHEPFDSPPLAERVKRRRAKKNYAGPAAVIDLSKESDLVKQTEQQNRSRLSTDMCCPVCFDKFSNVQLKATVCGHVFCSMCIETAVRQSKSCPTCRKKLTLKNLIPLYL